MSAPHRVPPFVITQKDPLVGRAIVDRYRVDRLIARGTSGRVYEGVQLGWDRAVAIKVLDSTTGDFDLDAARDRFEREAAVLARLRHPNTVRVIDAGTWEGIDYLVMEFVPGGTLKDHLESRRFSLPEAVSVARQICCSLHEAHLHGLVHRDLKPGNVLLTDTDHQQGFVKVVDFGLVTGLEGVGDVTMVDRIVGSPLYMAPEQIRGHAVDGRADLYALGGILFHMLAGRRAYAQDTTAAVLMAHLLNPLPSVSQVAQAQGGPGAALIPPCLETTVALLMEKAPSKRFASAEAVDDALEFCEQVLQGVLPFDTPLPDVLRPGAPLPVVTDDESFLEEDSMDFSRAPDPAQAPGMPPMRAALLGAAAILVLVASGIGLGLLAS